MPASAQLHRLAQQAGLVYFGAATDTPFQREREPWSAEQHARYEEILRDPDEFGQTTPTNGQKWLFTEPYPRIFNFTEGDVVADEVARKEGKLLRCHALVWHNQLAPWVEEKEWTKEELAEAIERHVRAVAGYYRGRCYAWDVVNEALDEDGSYRQSLFYRVLGEEYIRIAFRAAADADPGARLYYNDYGIERPNSNKTAGVHRLVRMLRQHGVLIDGIGMQGHFVAENHPSAEELEETMRGYAKLVDEVAVTELDVRINLPADEQKLQWQKEAYQKVVEACVKVRKCVGITIWDFYDPFSWVPHYFPGEGEPLLWFQDFTKHPAYDGIVEKFKELIAANTTRT